MIMYVLILLIVTVCLFCAFLKSRLNYWQKREIKNPPANIFFGNLTNAVILKQSFGQIITDIYNQYQDEPYVGFYKIGIPGLVVRDPELIENVLVKNFSNFHDNDIHIEENHDKLLGKNPFALKGNMWKIVRNQLIPCFSTGKMKFIYPFMQENSKKLVSYLEQPETLAEFSLEAKELCSKFTTENIANGVFGVEGNCFVDPKAEFREIGKDLLTPSFILGIKHMLVLLIPQLATKIKIKFFSDKIMNRLVHIVESNLKFREKNKIVRNDFLDILKALKNKPGEYKFTDEDIVAHAAGFFVDGFETSSVILSFAIYEIAANINVQEKLRNEIEEICKKRNGDITYEDVQEMNYLDCVVKESLRKNPAGLALMKICTIPTEFPNPDPKKQPIKIEKDTPIIIPVYALHHDEKYFPNPERFDPDRFLPENKDSITKFTYLPFGDGPRVCIGQRFGLLQVKTGIISIVKNFHIRVNKKTKNPLEMDPTYFMLAALGGIWIDFHRIKNGNF